jgi:hypothetical protein
MDRKSFTQKLALLGVCPFVIQNLYGSDIKNIPLEQDEKFKVIQEQKKFVENWLADLLESMDKNLDRETQERIVAIY